MVLAAGIDFAVRSCSASRADHRRRADLLARMLVAASKGQDCSPEEVLARVGNRQSQVDL